MAEGDFETCIPRLRRLALCLYCNITEGDEAVVIALGNLSNKIMSKGNDEVTIKFLFSEIVSIASDAFEGARTKIKVNLADMSCGLNLENNEAVILAVSELDFTERSVIALHILERINESDTAVLLQKPLPRVMESIRSARSHLSQQVTSPSITPQTALHL